MSEVVIDFFEVINIQQHSGYRVIIAVGKKLVAVVKQIAAVLDTRQAVRNRKMVHCLGLAFKCRKLLLDQQ